MKDWDQLSPQYQMYLLNRVGSFIYTGDDGITWEYCQGYSEKSYRIDITGLNEKDAMEKVNKFQEENFFNISINKLSHLSLEDSFIRIEKGISLIQPKNLSKAIEGLDWVLDCWRSKNESESAGIKYKRLKDKLINISRATSNENLIKDELVKSFTLDSEYESEISGIKGYCSKGMFSIWNYSPNGFTIDLTGLSKKEMIEKVNNFQQENFIPMDANDIEAVGLNEFYALLESHLKYTPLKDKTSIAISNFKYVLQCWKSQTNLHSDEVKYNGILEILDKLKLELNDVSNLQLPILENEINRDKSEFELSEEKDHPEFYNLFVENYTDKIKVVITALTKLKWIDRKQKWDLPQAICRGPVTDYCLTNHWIKNVSQSKRDSIFAERFGLDLKYFSGRADRKKKKKPYQQRLKAFEDTIKTILK